MNGRPIVLRDGKLWIDAGTKDGTPSGHLYAGYYLPYPDSKHEGLVTIITDVAPIMNWVYVNRATHEVQYGVRVDAQPNLTGPFDCTRQDRRLTLDGWEGWCAVEEQPGLWALYFDVNDDGLKGKISPGTKVFEVELSRKEKRFQKEEAVRQQDQTTQRAVDIQADAPVDQPLSQEAVETRPGVTGADAEEGEKAPKPFKPMNIPTSIFDDPPPLVAPLSFRPRTPKTPPPAYSPVAEQKLPSTLSRTSTSDTTKLPDTSPGAPQLPSKTSPRSSPDSSRRSGTRALAQVQKIEAITAAQQDKGTKFDRSSRRTSSASGTLNYASSGYSNDGGEVEHRAELDRNIIPKSSTAPDPWRPQKSPSKPMKLLSVRPRGATTAQKSATDPAISSASTTNKARLPSRPVRPSMTRQTSIIDPKTQRGPVTFAQSTNLSRQRQRSASNQSYLNNSTGRSSPHSQPASQTPSPRKSLARTMTTGFGNQGMTNRIAEKRTP